MALGRRHSDKQILDAFKRSREYNSYMTGAKYNPSNPYLYNSREMEGAKRWYNAGGRAALLYGEERRQSDVERGLNQSGYAIPAKRTYVDMGHKDVAYETRTPAKSYLEYLNQQVHSGAISTGKHIMLKSGQKAIGPTLVPGSRALPAGRGVYLPAVRNGGSASYGRMKALPTGQKALPARIPLQAFEVNQATKSVPYHNVATNALGTMAGMGADYILMKSIENGNNLMDHIITNGHNSDRVYTNSGKVADTFGDQNYPQSARNYMVTGKDGKRYFKWKEALRNGDIYTSPEGNIMYREGNPGLMKDGGGIGFLKGMGNKVPRNYLTQKMLDQIPEPDKHMIPGYRPQPGTPLRDGGELPGVVITGGGRQKPKARPRPRPVTQPQRPRLETIPHPGMPNIAPGFESGLPHTMEGPAPRDYVQNVDGRMIRPVNNLNEAIANFPHTGAPIEVEWNQERPQSIRDRRRGNYYRQSY